MERFQRFFVASAFALGLGGCDADAGRGVGPSGLGQPFGDPIVVENDGELLELLEAANAHLGDEEDWGLDDAPSSDDAGDSPPADDSVDGQYGDGADPAPAGSCSGSCGGEAPGGTCYCDAGCSDYGDCCGDYAQVCDAEDSGDGGDTGDTPPAGGSCSGACGGQGSGECFCDDQCVTSGDCCSDYAAQCDGGDGGDGGDSGDQPPPAGGSCAGACGGQGSGECYCDDLCATSGDCCADYDTECGVGGPEHQPGVGFEIIKVGQHQSGGGGGGGLAQLPDVQAGGGGVCMALIDDDIEVGKILSAAGRSAAKQGARCFATAVVVTVGSGGTAAPATSVVCIASSAGAGVIGGAKEYIRQKRADLALCGASVISSAMSAILSTATAIGVYESRPEVEDDADADAETQAKMLELIDRSCTAGTPQESAANCRFYFHYTNESGWNGIMGSPDTVIRADNKNRVYMTWLPYSPQDVRTSLVFQGDNGGKGDYMIAFQLNADVPIRAGDSPNEVIHDGSLRLKSKATIVYSGRNFFP